MGLMRFIVHPESILADWPEIYRGYLCGADGRVFATRIEVEGNTVLCRRTTSESAKFYVGWPISGYGRPVTGTASLPEREEPYLLAVELARGKIVQIRNQASQWEVAGMVMPADFAEPSAEAHRLFARAASSQDRPQEASRLADEALRLACVAADRLTLSYAQQSLAGRQKRYPQLPALLGCELGGQPPPPDAEELFLKTFSAAAVRCSWVDIESAEGDYNWDVVDRQLAWCEAHKLEIRAGSLIDLGPGGLPSWLANWEHDILNVQSFVCDFAETTITRFLGRIGWWEVVARANSGGALTLNEEHRLTLTARVLDVARQVDDEAQLLIRVDQPWGDYQARGQHRLSPLQMTDALIRSGIGLAGVNLEIACGYLPRGSALRDLLEVSRLIDLWSILQVPLHITLACPSSALPDPHASPLHEVDAHLWSAPPDESRQAQWLNQCLRLLTAKPAVASVTWGAFSDAMPHEFPHAGLLRGDGSPKPALESILSFQLGRRPKPSVPDDTAEMSTTD
jgi:hypothetical protein